MWIRSFLLIVLYFALFSGLHSLMASRTFKNWFNRLFPSCAGHYRWIFNGIAFLTILPVLLAVKQLPSRTLYLIPSPWVFLTLFFQLLAVVIFLVGYLSGSHPSLFGFLTTTAPADTHFTSEGLYRFVRHPIYTFSLVMIWLAPSMSSNQLALTIAVTIYFIIGSRLEEQKLVQEFPDYRDYQKKVPRFIPRLKR